MKKIKKEYKKENIITNRCFLIQKPDFQQFAHKEPIRKYIFPPENALINSTIIVVVIPSTHVHTTLANIYHSGKKEGRLKVALK